MVQQRVMGDTLQAEDYLWPLTTLRDTLLRPDVERHIPRTTVKLLLKWHLERLQKPWEPFASASSASRSAITGSSLSIPRSSPSVKLDIDVGSRTIALRLSDEIGIDEISAILLWKSYASHSIEDPNPAPGQSDEDALLERILLWYEQETLAVPQIVMALYVPSSEPTGWEDLAAELKSDILGDEAGYIEGLFRAFSSIAQKSVDPSKMSKALYWATLQLRQQETILDLLFLVLYQFTTRPAVVSEGLLKGAVLSSFGTAQANGEIWEHDAECQRLLLRIRDLTLVIAVESLCLAQIVSPEAGDEGDTFGATLLHSRDRIHAVHQFVMEQSDELIHRQSDGGNASNGEIVFPAWPIPIICLAWSVVLRSLPVNLLPPTGDYFHLDTTEMDNDEPVIYLEAASRALRLSSGLFPWLEAVLLGPLFEPTKDAFSGDLAVDMAALRRSPLKDLLIGLAELIQIENIVDRPGLYRAWELLFGGGTHETSTSLANNFWSVDYAYEERRAVLDKGIFPRQPTYLPRVLAALTGVSSNDELDLTIVLANAVPDVFDYVNDLPFVTHVVPPSSFVTTGKDNQGKLTVEAAVDFELPGGTAIPRRTRGIIVSGPDDTSTVVSWRFRQSGWALLIEILRGAAGLSTSSKHVPTADPGVIRLTLVDLGVQGSLPDILAAGLQLIRCVLRSPEVASRLVRGCGGVSDRFPGQSLLDLSLTVLGDRTSTDIVTATYAIDILQSLLLTGSDEIWLAFRASGFFDSQARRQGSVAALIQNDAMKGHHGLTIALLRLVRSLASANAGDPIVVRSALKLVLAEVWSQFSAWRYRDVSKKYEIAALLINIFDLVLRHPLGVDGLAPTPAAAFLIETFITAASPLTYKPLVDVFTQAVPLATKLIQSRRWADSDAVFNTFDHAFSLLATLLRLSPSLGVSATALPHSVFSSTVVLGSGERIQLVESLFDLISRPSLQATSLRLVIRLLKVYLETSSHDPQRPSLAGMLRRAQDTCQTLASVAFNAGLTDVKPDAWALLATVIATQPGCATFCVGTPSDEKVEGALKFAVDEVLNWKGLVRDGPRALAAILAYCQSVLESPSAAKGVSALRKHNAFWQAIHDIAVKFVPLPSSFSEHIATDVQDYCYTVQAKANATALLAAELGFGLDSDSQQQPETVAQRLVLSMFRNSNTLQDAALASIHSSCDPELHAAEAALLDANSIKLAQLRTTCLPDERDYGVQYLYDGVPIIFNDSDRQSQVSRSLAILNLNWSQLDADVALTKSWLLLADVAASYTESDMLAAKATLRAAAAVATELSNEDRGGDVMLAIQAERLGILATLLETALDSESEVAEPDVAKQLAKDVRSIVESQLFSPILSLRHPELPAIHRPVLRILLLLSQAQTATAEAEVREVLFDSGATFALEAADIVLDTVMRASTVAAEQDLALVVALLCEMSRVTASSAIWIDKLQEVNLIPRSLEVIVRSQPIKGTLSPHVHTILLLHLALASTGPTAEKLAVSGVLPAYADNAIATAAEQARIDPAASNDSLHRAWCAMLLVVKALLASLPNTASFARSDVVPFIRVVVRQLLRALTWDGETPLSRPALDELELVADIFYGLAVAVGGGAHGLLTDYAPPALSLLKGIRYALSHPHRFSALIVPSSEGEQAALEKELEAVEAQKEDVNLVDAVKTPVVAERTTALVRVTRTVLVTLVRFTRAWELLSGEQEAKSEYMLQYDNDDVLSVSTDPVGIINDLFLLVTSIADKFGPGSGRATATQAGEAAALVSVTQLLARRALNPETTDDDGTATGVAANGAGASGNGSGSGGSGAGTGAGAGAGGVDDAMDVDAVPGRRRVSLAAKPADRGAQVRRELEADVRGMLPDPQGAARGVAAASAMLEVLRNVADREFVE